MRRLMYIVRTQPGAAKLRHGTSPLRDTNVLVAPSSAHDNTSTAHQYGENNINICKP